MTAFPQIGDPAFVPKGRPDLARLAGRCLAAFEPRILAAVEEFVRHPGAEAFLRFEEDVLRQFMLAASHVAAGAVAFLHDEGAIPKNRRPRPPRARTATYCNMLFGELTVTPIGCGQPRLRRRPFAPGARPAL